jgi:hypothetical protein
LLSAVLSYPLRAARRYTKLRLWDEDKDFDFILFADSNSMAIGRFEAALESFAPNGVAPSPLGAVRDEDTGTFRSGVLAVRPSHALFQEMIKAAENKEVEWDGKHAEQARCLRLSAFAMLARCPAKILTIHNAGTSIK